MADTNKYLDLSGVELLWKAVKAEDEKNSNALNNLTIIYDSEQKKIGLSNNGKDLIEDKSFDASSFIKDGVLDKVEIIDATTEAPIDYNGMNYTTGKFIRFTWSAEAGKDVNYLKVDEIGKVYTGSNSIDIASDNVLTVKEVKSDITKTSEAIPVAGGPLADLLNKAGIDNIAADTDFQSLLSTLFCKELYPTVTRANGSVKVSIATPSFTLDSSGSTVEVGTKVNVSTTTIPSDAKVNAEEKGYSGIEYGYADELDGEKTSSSKTYYATKTTSLKNGDTYGMTRSYTGFSDTENETATSNTDCTQVSLAEKELTVGEGECTVKVDITGPHGQVTYGGLAEKYVCSNLGKTSNDHVLDAITGETVTSSNAATSSKSLSITGVRYAYIGTSETAVTDLTSDYIRTNLTQTAKENATKVNSSTDSKSIIIAFPTSWGVLTSLTDDDAVGGRMEDNFIDTIVDVYGANGFTAIPYHVYVYTPDSILDKVNYTFKIGD